jgi:hypothetical protein
VAVSPTGPWWHDDEPELSPLLMMRAASQPRRKVKGLSKGPPSLPVESWEAVVMQPVVAAVAGVEVLAAAWLAVGL